ncbi:ABC transporter permease [Streptomyces sp. NPDC096105]|uniref:ABC transporter permease n=1 Tax=Streptomyces sp. NPDC096105 TaxID=3366074 RepID=UPI00381DE4B8
MHHHPSGCTVRARRRGLVPARLTPRDVWQVGSSGLRTRPVRVVLSALGIALGIATMVAVVGVSASGKAGLARELDRLGTNMLVITPGQSLLTGKQAKLPRQAPGMVARVDGVESVTATGAVDAKVYRSEHMPPGVTGGLTVLAAGETLPRTLRTGIAQGRWLDRATGTYPSVVLGHVAAERLGVRTPGDQVWIRDRYFTVLGVLDPVPLAPEIERAALIGWTAARTHLGFDGHPTSLYERSTDASVNRVRELLPRTVNPEAPRDVQVSNPSDALAAKAASEAAFSTLLLGLGGVALLVGGVGVANTMIVSVLERRGEIGLRRALGGTRGQVRLQFLTESLLLSLLGGVAGILAGAGVTAGYAALNGLPWTLPPWAAPGCLAAALLIGSVAGLYPAVRAARLPPTLALHA